MNYNHIINPSYFDDIIEEFSFEYDWYVITDIVVDELGYQKNKYTLAKIKGSLQPQGMRRNYNKEGNTTTNGYDFYCKSIYRINIGDFINYNEDYLIVVSVSPYDEYGVRKCTLESANMSQYQDLLEFKKALTGEIIV